MKTLATYLLITQLVTTFTYRMDSWQDKSKVLFSKWCYDVVDTLPDRWVCATNEILKNAFDAELGKPLDNTGFVRIDIHDDKVVISDSGVIVPSHLKLQQRYRYFGGRGVGLLQAEIMAKRVDYVRKNDTTEVTLWFGNQILEAA